jgi:hypothetical protein
LTIEPPSTFFVRSYKTAADGSFLTADEWEKLRDIACRCRDKKQMISGHQKVVVILFIIFSPLTSYSSIKVAQNQVFTRTIWHRL